MNKTDLVSGSVVVGVDDHVLAVVRQSKLRPGPGPGVAGDGRYSRVTFLAELLNLCHCCQYRGLWSVYTVQFLQIKLMI